MGLIAGALQIGRSALLSYQSALEVIGNNISNAGSEGYTRNTAILSPQMGSMLPEGFQAGAGVALTAMRRNVDEALESRLRIALGDDDATAATRNTLGRLESILNELSDTDLSSLLDKFFNAFSNLQNSPQDISARGIVITAGQSVVDEIRRQRNDVLSLVGQVNEEIVDITRQASQIAGEIASLNEQIVQAESAQRGAIGALRDQRDAKLRELSTVVQVNVQPQDNGSVNVYLGNELLIQGSYSRGLTTKTEISNGLERVIPVFADDGGTARILGGRLEGLVRSRDAYCAGHLADLDTLAAGMIQEVNKVHAQGQGLYGLTGVSGTYAVLDENAALNSNAAGLDLHPQNGTFQITVKNKATGAATTATIAVDLDGLGSETTLNSLVAAINAGTDNIAASVTADRRLQIAADSGFEFTFAEDTSNVLAALGVNTFFTGKAANDIGVNAVLTADASLLAAARTGLPGDGTNAAALSRVRNQNSSLLGGQSLMGFYNAVAGKIAVNGQATRAQQSAANAITTSLQAQRESVSGVSLDEEAIQLLRFQRAFQGAARYVTVVDQLINELLGIVK